MVSASRVRPENRNGLSPACVLNFSLNHAVRPGASRCVPVRPRRDQTHASRVRGSLRGTPTCVPSAKRRGTGS